jgi:hypothetical protein
MAARSDRAERLAARAVALALAVAPLAAVSACASPPKAKASAPPTVCAVSTKVGSDLPAKDRQFPPGYWFGLLLSGYRDGGVVPRPAVDCSGRPAAVDREGCGGEATYAVTPAAKVTAKDLLVSTVTETTRLAWAMIDRVADGEVQGPVGLVEITDQGLKVRALGVLRAYPEGASLRLVRVGAGSLLVAEGERCDDRASPEHCPRAIRFLSLAGERFVPLTVNDDKGACLGKGFVTLATAGTDSASGDGYRLETQVSFAPDEVTLHEQLTISAKGGAGGFVRVVRADRHLGLGPAGLVASGPALVSRFAQSEARRAGASEPR